MDETQLHCQECGLCSIEDLRAVATRMGYHVLVAEGTPSVLKLITAGKVDAILGVACLNVLEKAFDRVLQVGLPALAIPLLRDTCHNTAVDEDWVLAALGYGNAGASQVPTAATATPQATRSFVPLLRDVPHYFDAGAIEELIPADRGDAPETDKVAETERIALAWLRQGGKRFRPFVTAAAWQALTDEDVVPLHVKRVAVAMEIFHKASLVHDDIEDGDDFRYGAAAVHKAQSVPVALNVGDYLIGRGYRLVADALPAIGAEKVALIMQRLTHAHVKLCEGQGAELLWRRSGDKQLPPLECLRLYALKTAPAFSAALYAGVILGGGGAQWDDAVAEFAKHLGVAY
jgi:geranylgeranyl diphosphate synthase, type II